MGVPRVTPCSVPDWISTASYSFRYERRRRDGNERISPDVVERRGSAASMANGFTHGSGQIALPRSSSRQLGLDIFIGQSKAL